MKDDEKLGGGSHIERGAIPNDTMRVTLPPEPLSDESESLPDRLEKFNKKLVALLTEYGFGLGSEASIVEGKIVSKPVVVDQKK